MEFRFFSTGFYFNTGTGGLQGLLNRFRYNQATGGIGKKIMPGGWIPVVFLNFPCYNVS